MIKDLPNNKAPGMDRLLYEFYKEVYKDILSCCSLTFSMQKGAIRLTPKVKVVPKIDELCLITLLQSDYKILTNILVNRMIVVMTEIIKSGQLCSVKGKHILF